MTKVRSGAQHPFGALERYVPMQDGQTALYRAVREAVPIVDAAILKLIRLCGGMGAVCERAQAQGAEYGHGPEREAAYLAVHSVLNLLGYDHLDEGPQKAQMRAREEAILNGLGITRGEEADHA